jgi:hypothetical protein
MQRTRSRFVLLVVAIGVACTGQLVADGDPPRASGTSGATGAGGGGRGGADLGGNEAEAGAPALPSGDDGSAGDGGAIGRGGETGDPGEPSDGAGEGPLTAFTGAPAFEPQEVLESARSLSSVDPTGTPCLDCHNILHDAPFLVGGTVFLDHERSAPAPGVEVRIVDASDGSAFSAYTDEDGNFWVSRSSPVPKGPFLIGVRNGEVERHMPLAQRSLNCNLAACHGETVPPVSLGESD